MVLADLQLPTRLLAGGGPSTPDLRVLRALTTPLIGQFDPDFTAVMDDLVELARRTFLTTNRRCFAVSGLASAGLEAVLNSLLHEGDRIAVAGGPGFVSSTATIARGYGVEVVALETMAPGTQLLVAPLIDPALGTVLPIREMASKAHVLGAQLVVDATMGLAVCELRVDEWSVDVCVAGIDYGIGAPPGLALVTYSSAIEASMASREMPPRTSYLDLLQLQAYWSPERLNHHTAPTSLVYGLREALRLADAEGLHARWRRHHEIGQSMRSGLESLGLEVSGDIPFSIVHLPAHVNEANARRTLLDEFGVYVSRVGLRQWRVGLLGADARQEHVRPIVCALERVLRRGRAC